MNDGWPEGRNEDLFLMLADAAAELAKAARMVGTKDSPALALGWCEASAGTVGALIEILVRRVASPSLSGKALMQSAEQEIATLGFRKLMRGRRARQ
jgi:hypothetical protein